MPQKQPLPKGEGNAQAPPEAFPPPKPSLGYSLCQHIPKYKQTTVLRH